MNVEEQNDQMTAINLLFEDLYETERKLSPTQIWNAEINLFQNLPRAEGASDPLDWWKAHSSQLPTLGVKMCLSFVVIFFNLFLFTFQFFSFY